jgi:acetyl esterase/lipase
MRRAYAVLLTLVLALSITGAESSALGARSGGAARQIATKPQQPDQPATGPGGRDDRFAGVIEIEQLLPGDVEPEYWIFVPSEPVPGTPIASEPLPLVIFVHSYTRRSPGYYLGWIEHLVRRGAIVIFSEFEEDATSGSGYRENLHEDVLGALDTLQDRGVAYDPERVAVVGHSVGGVLAVDYASGAAAAGVPIPAVILSIAPGCAAEMECLDANPAKAPAATRALLVLESEEADPTSGGAANLIWERLSSIPSENRNILTVASDTYGVPWLLATHDQAHAAVPGDAEFRGDVPDALDWYGTWKWLDALMSCSFTHEWCEYALGDTPEQRFMGTWSDGVPVAEPSVSNTFT